MTSWRRTSAIAGFTSVALMAAIVSGCGPTVVPSATPVGNIPTPTTSGQGPQPTFVSTNQPILQPSTQPSIPPQTPPLQSPDAVFAGLLPHVPEAIRDTCVPSEPLEPAIAMVSCVADDDAVAVDYIQYPDLDSMNAAYNARVRIAEIETDSGLCFRSEDGTISAAPNRWPAEHQYSVDGQPAGRYLCLELDLPSITWTDERFLILSEASPLTAGLDRLVWIWLNEAGPNL